MYRRGRKLKFGAIIEGTPKAKEKSEPRKILAGLSKVWMENAVFFTVMFPTRRIVYKEAFKL
jgi:hypothetical protein